MCREEQWKETIMKWYECAQIPAWRKARSSGHDGRTAGEMCSLKVSSHSQQLECADDVTRAVMASGSELSHWKLGEMRSTAGLSHKAL